MSEKPLRRLSARNAEVPRTQPEHLRQLGLGTEPLEREVEGTSAYPAGTSNPAAIAGRYHDTAADAGRGSSDRPVAGKSPFSLHEG